MPDEPNFLLGRGERLTKSVGFHSGFGASEPPYQWGGRRAHIVTQLRSLSEYFKKLPAAACPLDQVVSIVELHPQYYSRSAFPEALLRASGLRLVGSMPTMIKPRAGRGSVDDEGAPSTAMFLAGTRRAYDNVLTATSRLTPDDPLTLEWLKIESLQPQTEEQRIGGPISTQTATLEIVLHFDALIDYRWEDQFIEFATEAGVELDPVLQYQSRGLWFLAARGNVAAAKRMAHFSFVRSVRPMPKMRVIDTPHVLRMVRGGTSVTVPAEEAILQ